MVENNIYITIMNSVMNDKVSITGAYPTKELAKDAIALPPSIRPSGAYYETIKEVKLYTLREDIETYCKHCSRRCFYDAEGSDFPLCNDCKEKNNG